VKQKTGTQTKPSVIKRSLGVFCWAEDRPALPGAGAQISTVGTRVEWRLMPFGQVEVWLKVENGPASALEGFETII
jgi:hypothetical protein